MKTVEGLHRNRVARITDNTPKPLTVEVDIKQKLKQNVLPLSY